MHIKTALLALALLAPSTAFARDYPFNHTRAEHNVIVISGGRSLIVTDQVDGSTDVVTVASWDGLQFTDGVYKWDGKSLVKANPGAVNAPRPDIAPQIKTIRDALDEIEAKAG